MCKCTPSIRTPFCGKPGCEWPKPKPVYECSESGCNLPVKYLRCTQFAGDHPYCDRHAKAEPDFYQINSDSDYWTEIN